jgi:undecaprenyl-diphosphatase
LTGLLKYLLDIDNKILLWVNAHNNPFWDEIMLAFSERFFWVPFYTMLVLLIIYKFRKRSILILITITLMIIATDQFSSHLLKPLVGRLRPCYDESLMHLLHMIKDCGGRYGFISSHASNSFGAAMILWMLFRKQFKYFWLMFVWAAVVSYSRIYLGVHFPSDIIGGMFCGLIFGYLFFQLYSSAEKKVFNKNI